VVMASLAGAVDGGMASRALTPRRCGMASLPAIPCSVSYHLSFLNVYKNDWIDGRRACVPALKTAVCEEGIGGGGETQTAIHRALGLCR